MMTTANTPLLMVAVFLLLTLLIGLYFSRRKSTFREYAVGNKKFATTTLVATVLATIFGGESLVRMVQHIHNLGIYYIAIFLFYTVISLIMEILVAARITPFIHHLSMAETVGSAYGKYPRVITALFSICGGISMVAIQINVMSLAIKICFDSGDLKIITILATIILILYSTLGGVRAVTFTDVFQCATFTIIIPLLAWFMFVKINKPAAEIIPFLQTYEKFQFSSLLHFDTKLLYWLFLMLVHVLYFSPPVMQRMYMTSGPIQARQVVVYSSIFGFIILMFIILIGLFVFIAAPELPISGIWSYITTNIPLIFKGLLSISLLAMTMSSADSELNTCSVMMTHDIIGTLRNAKAIPDTIQLLLARVTTIVVGGLAMVLAFYYTSLVDLIKLAFYFVMPIVIAPFLLAIFGFRATSHTALIGMITGLIAIISWKKWIEPTTGINGSFLAMAANGLTMLIAHYLLPKPTGTGWVEPDKEFQQIQQAKERRRYRRKKKITAFFSKTTLLQLLPDTQKLLCAFFYIAVTTIASMFCNQWDNNLIGWHIMQMIAGLCLIVYAILGKYHSAKPSWQAGACWLVVLIFCLPLDAAWHWVYGPSVQFALTLSFAHCGVLLLLLPLYFASSIAVATLVGTVYHISAIGSVKGLLCRSNGYTAALGIAIFLIIAYYKEIQTKDKAEIKQLEAERQQRRLQKQKQIAYTHRLDHATTQGYSETEIMGKAIRDIAKVYMHGPERHIAPEEICGVMDKFIEWVQYLDERSKLKSHLFLEPTTITLYDLINQVEINLATNLDYLPRLFVQEGVLVELPIKMTWSQIKRGIQSVKSIKTPQSIQCDVTQVTQLLATAVTQVLDKGIPPFSQLVDVAFYPTKLQFTKSDPKKIADVPYATYPAVAIVISNQVAETSGLPVVQSCYDDKGYMEYDYYPRNPLAQINQIDIERNNMRKIIYAHYGHIQFYDPVIPNRATIAADRNGSNRKTPTLDPTADSILIVLPQNISSLRDQLLDDLIPEELRSPDSIQSKAMGDALMAMVEFQTFVTNHTKANPTMVAQIMRTIKESYGFKKHGCGELFFIRSIGIARLVAETMHDAPNSIYASLLYDLPRYTTIPLTYIRANYDMYILALVQNILAIDQHKYYTKPITERKEHRHEMAVIWEHFKEIYIKLVERLYDLTHAAGYSDKSVLETMAKDTLVVDVLIAKKYFPQEGENSMTNRLDAAARKALDLAKGSSLTD